MMCLKNRQLRKNARSMGIRQGAFDYCKACKFSLDKFPSTQNKISFFGLMVGSAGAGLVGILGMVVRRPV